MDFEIQSSSSEDRGELTSISVKMANQIMFWSLLVIVILLTWIGARPVEDPYILVGQILTVLYFLYYLLNPIIMKIWDKLIQ